MSNCPNAKTDWYFPDMYLPDISNGISHEAVCVLNVGEADAQVEFILYFEDQEPMTGFYALCPAKRTKHIRLDKLTTAAGEPIPQCRPYACHVASSVPVLCQYTRLDATEPRYALMTAMGI